MHPHATKHDLTSERQLAQITLGAGQHQHDSSATTLPSAPPSPTHPSTRIAPFWSEDGRTGRWVKKHSASFPACCALPQTAPAMPASSCGILYMPLLHLHTI